MAQFTPYKGEEISEEEAVKKFTPYQGEEVSEPTAPVERPLIDQAPGTPQPFDQGRDDFMSGKMFAEDPSEFQDIRNVAAAAKAQKVRDQNSDLTQMRQSLPGSTVAKPVLKGLINGVNSGIETGLAIGDTAVEDASILAKDIGLRGRDAAPYNPGMAEKFHNTIPYLNPDEGFGQEFIQKTAEAAPGMILGDKGFSKLRGVADATTKLGKAGTIMGRGVASNAGGAITQDEGDPTIMQSIRGDGPVNDPNSSYSGNVIQQKIKQATEAVIVGALTGGASRAVTTSAKYGDTVIRKTLAEWQSIPAHKKAFVTDALEIASGVTPDMTKEQITAAMTKTADFVANHKDVITKFADNSVPDVQHEQDLVTILLSRLDKNNPRDAEIAANLEGLRSSALSGGSPGLKVALERPKGALKGSLDKFEETRGGTEAIKTSKDEVVTHGQNQLEGPRQAVRDARSDLASANRGLDAEMAESPAFKDYVKRNPSSDGTIRLDRTGPRLDKADDIAKTLGTADEADTGYKNKTFDDISDDAKVNPTSFADALEAAQPVMDDTMRATVPSSGNFKELNKWATTYLEPSIQKARKDGEWAKVDVLRTLKKNITEDQLDYLVTSGQGAARDKVVIARDNFKNDYAPKWRDGALGELQENNRFLPEGEAAKANRDLVEKTLSDPTERINTDKIISVLKSQSGNHSEKQAGDYIKYRIAGELTDAFTKSKGGKLSPEDYLKVSKVFDDYMPVLKQTDPDSIPELEKFFNQVKDKNFNAKDAEAALLMLEERGKGIEDQVLGSELKEFFTKSSLGNYTAKDDGYTIFEKIMDDPEASARLQNSLRGINDPDKKELIDRGMQAAWAKSAQKKLFTDSDTVSGELEDNFIKAGKEIFGEDSLAVDGVIELRRMAKAGQDADKTRMTGGFGMNDSQTNAVKAVRTLTTWVFGVLNPTAAKVNTISRDLMSKNSSYGKAKFAADQILKNKDEFNKIAREIIHAGDNKITPAQQALLRRIFVRGGTITATTDRTKDDLDTQTNKALKK